MPISVYRRCDSPWNHFCANLDLEFIIGGLARNYLDWRRSGITTDPFFRLYYPTKGHFTLKYASGHVHVTPGNAYLFPPWVSYRFEPGEPCSHYWAHFVSERLRFHSFFSRPLKLSLDAIASDEYRAMFSAALKNAPNAANLREAMRIRLGLERLILPFIDLTPRDDSSDHAQAIELKPIIDYIEKHFMTQIKIADLTRLAGLPRAEFSQKFNAAFGLPPKQYISARRISHAKNLLLETTLAVKEIAVKCGYDNEYFFSRVFKKYTYFPPKRFRERYAR